MPFQARQLVAICGLVAMTNAASAACAVDERELKAKLGNAGFLIDDSLVPVSRPEPPKFPSVAVNWAIGGQVDILQIIAPNGAVADRVVLCAEPFGYFQPNALAWAKNFAFAPLPKDVPEKYRVYFLTVRFKLR
ncbi:hypothetical protein sos41_03740 [Alphaproteobacteria bacterium SO-S41]|nr:hypothetical protein sos41_03740 [Alphaproteobacteria bacterium SO-S41]